MGTRWRFLDLSYSTVFQNLALEEALARSSGLGSAPTVRVWTDPRAVVLGRFQEVDAEVDANLCRTCNVEIARRFTGGGTVFHDEGNLNLSIATRKEDSVSLAKFQAQNCVLISTLLDQLGVPSNFVPPNSIEISGKKVSGAAAALGRHFAFWHASILISTDIHMLNQVLRPSRNAKPTKFIRSNRREVTTLDRTLGRHLEIDYVKSQLIHSCARVFDATLESGTLSSIEEELMRELHSTKYLSREWNMHGLCEDAESGRRGDAQTTIAV